MELAMRNRIVCFKEAGGKHHRKPFAERLVDLVDDSPTGEVLLDETLKLMKSEQFGVDSTGKATGNRHTIIDWIDLLSGETWNILRSSLQLKLVRERLSKGLVDKGVLRTEKKNFLVFEMTTHPVADPAVKSEIVNRVVDLLLNRGPKPTRRTIALACAVGAASLLENALSHFTAHTGTSLSYSQKDACFARYEELLVEYSGTQAMERSNAAGGSADMLFKDMQDKGRMGWSEIMFGVVNVFIKMDSVLI
jgi:Golgi phosphoprotein 3